MSRRRKILYLITRSDWGGAQKYIYDLALHIPREAYDVKVAIGTDGPLVSKLRASGVPVVRIKKLERDVEMFKKTTAALNPITVIRSVLHEIRVLRELLDVLKKERPDVLHVNSSKASGLGMFATRFFVRGVRGIFTVHGWGFLEDRSIFVKALLSFLSWLTTLLSHKTILVSYNDLAKARWMPFVQNKFIVIHNATEPPNFLTRESAREALFSRTKGIANTETWLYGTISELTGNKGLHYLIDACALLRDEGHSFLYYIIGEGEDRENLKKHIKDKELIHNVFLVGFIENAAQYLRAFDVFSLTSIKEGLPYVVLEAGHAGIPVVASGVGGIPEIITDMHSGMLLKPKHPQELADALRYLSNHETQREIFGKNLQKHIRKNFSSATMRKKTYLEYDY